MTVLRAAFTVGSFTMVSRVTGFARDMLIAAALGAGPAADAFFVSLKLANLFRRLFAEGAFGSGFVPLFGRALAEGGRPAAARFAANAAGLLLAALVPTVLLAELGMPWIVRVIATGFDPAGERYALAVALSRVTFPYLALISLTALVGAVLNGLGRFAAAAAAPVLANLVLIGAAGLAAVLGLAPAPVLAWGVAAAGCLQLLALWLVAARLGYPLVPGRVVLDARLRRFLVLLLPGLGGAGLGQLVVLLNAWFASHLPAGAVSHLFYADRLVQLPIGLVGAALGTALLPALSTAVRAGDRGGAEQQLAKALHAGFLLTLPAAAGLLLLAGPIIRVLFERGAFGPEAALATAGALRAMAVGLPAAIAMRVLAPAFFAREDTATPVRAAMLSLAAQAGLTLLLIGRYAETGIALAGSLAGCLNVALLALALHRRGQLPAGQGLALDAARTLAATLAMLLALAALRPALAGLPETGALALSVAAGGARLPAGGGGTGALRGWRLPLPARA